MTTKTLVKGPVTALSACPPHSSPGPTPRSTGLTPHSTPRSCHRLGRPQHLRHHHHHRPLPLPPQAPAGGHRKARWSRASRALHPPPPRPGLHDARFLRLRYPARQGRPSVRSSSERIHQCQPRSGADVRCQVEALWRRPAPGSRACQANGRPRLRTDPNLMRWTELGRNDTCWGRCSATRRARRTSRQCESAPFDARTEIRQRPRRFSRIAALPVAISMWGCCAAPPSSSVRPVSSSVHAESAHTAAVVRRLSSTGGELDA
jgi:hypothetical protein